MEDSAEARGFVADGWKVDFCITVSKLSEKQLERSEIYVSL